MQQKVDYKKVIQDLQAIKLDLLFDAVSLEKYSHDASLFTVMPQIIIFPKDKWEIVKIVRYVKEYNLSITPLRRRGSEKLLSITARAAGTCMSGGSLNDSIILDVTKYMDKVGEFDVKNKTIISEPGVYFRDLEKVLNTKNLMFPSYPASKDLCCVGGIVANNSAGEKTLLYGQTKDWLEEIEVVLEDGSMYNFKKISFSELEKIIQPTQVLADTALDIASVNIYSRVPIGLDSVLVSNVYGKIFNLINENENLIEQQRPKVSKNSSGYNIWDIVDFENKTIDMCKLICGSQGTFGIITSVKLKLIEKKPYSQMLTVLMPDLNNLVSLVNEILKYKPEAIETFDDHTFKIAMKFLPQIIWKMRGSIFQLAFSFIPEAWMAITGGIPKLILMAEFTGATQEEADRQANLALQNIQNIKSFKYKSRVTKNKIDLEKYWLFRRESFNLLRSKLKGFRTAPFVEDVIIPIDKMQEFIPQMQIILDKYNFTYTIAGHAGNGNFHIIPLMKLNSNREVEDIKKCNDEVFTLVQKYHGSISAEHNDGLVRTPYLHYMFNNEMLKLFQKVKNIFDPENIFNPGKKVGGSVEENYRKIKLTDNR